MVSAGTAFGATGGWLRLDDGRRGLEATWDPARCAALPLLTVRRIGERRFVRLAFSVAEIDETQREGARLRDFELTVRGFRAGSG